MHKTSRREKLLEEALFAIMVKHKYLHFTVERETIKCYTEEGYKAFFKWASNKKLDTFTVVISHKEAMNR
jgi:hypothetical protein